MLAIAKGRPYLIGVVHLLGTPGAPRAAGMAALLERARDDARALARGGCDALIVENFGDAPFEKSVLAPETVAAMALALAAVRDEAGGLPVGVNCLRNAARAALGLCAATGAEFLRVNVHVGAAVTDQGVIEGEAASTLRERARLCPEASILADVHVKHATPLGRETLAEAARETLERGLADGLIVSGRATGLAPEPRALAEVREVAGNAPLLVGSGLSRDNARDLLRHADGALVGTSLKHDGRTGEPVDVERVRALRQALDARP
jgi:membrane complex biogenesis BtpA family protein